MMTSKQVELVNQLRTDLYVRNYPPIYIVSNEVLEAVERSIEDWLEEKGLPPILQCGKNGLLFKGVELILEVK